MNATLVYAIWANSERFNACVTPIPVTDLEKNNNEINKIFMLQPYLATRDGIITSKSIFNKFDKI